MTRDKMIEKIARRLGRLFNQREPLPLAEAEAVLDLVEKFGMAPPESFSEVRSLFSGTKKFSNGRTWDYK